MKASRVWGWIGTFAFLVLMYGAFLNRQWLVDEFNVLTYKPATAIASIASQDQLTNTGQRYFYASRPQIEDRTGFTKDCGSHEATVSVLGCYAGQRIYLFDVTDQELDGIEQVTAAHEMLHAAYDRLSDTERQKIDALLLAEADKLKSDPTFSARIAVYAKLPSDQYVNELHSVIGTEVADPGSALENYYTQYFKDRASVVSMHAAYISVFTNLENQANQLSQTLTAEAATIKSDGDSYKAQSAQLQADIDAFNARASQNGGFTSQAEFNQTRAALVARTDALNAFREQINQLVATYNANVVKFNSMETHLTTLNNDINSNLAPAPAV